MNDAGVLALYVAVAEAIETWEPRFELTGVQLDGNVQGQLNMILSGTYLPKAHLGDLDTVSDDVRTVQFSSGRADAWSFSQ
jgi:phage baseplate assembly protein W